MEEDQGDGLRARSFRYEDYTNRRVFLKSYPLYFDRDDCQQDSQSFTTAHSYKASNGLGDTYDYGYDDKKKKEKKMKMKKKKEAIKKILVTIVEWGDERVVVFKRFKHKVSFYVVTCFPIVFKPPKALISTH